MGATNQTTELKLSQFVDDDKPTWLGDYNGDMRKIEQSFGAIKTVGTDAQKAADEAKAAAATAGQQATQAVAGVRNDLTADIQTAAASVQQSANAYTDTQMGTVPGEIRRIAQEVVRQSGADTGPLGPFQALMRKRGVSARVVVMGSGAAAETVTDEPFADWFSRLAYRAGATSVEDADSATIGSGIQFIRAAKVGLTSADYANTAIADKVVNLAPNVVIHHIGSQDYVTNVDPALYENRVRAAIADLENRIPAAVNVLALPVRREDTTGAWDYDQYSTALRKIAGEAPTKRVFIDTAYVLGNRRGFWGMLEADKITLSRSGHLIVADTIGSYMGIPDESEIRSTLKIYDLGTAGTKTLQPPPGTGADLVKRIIEATPYPRKVLVTGVINVTSSSAANRVVVNLAGVDAQDNPIGGAAGAVGTSPAITYVAEQQSTPQNVNLGCQFIIPPNKRALVMVQALAPVGASAATTINIRGGNRATQLYSHVSIADEPY